jgi:hypothetical protein
MFSISVLPMNLSVEFLNRDTATWSMYQQNLPKMNKRERLGNQMICMCWPSVIFLEAPVWWHPFAYTNSSPISTVHQGYQHEQLLMTLRESTKTANHLRGNFSNVQHRKPKVQNVTEGGVPSISRWIVARLREQNCSQQATGLPTYLQPSNLDRCYCMRPKELMQLVDMWAL